MSSYRTGSLRAWLVAVDKDCQRELRQVVQSTANEAKAYLTDVTSDWTHKIQFRRVMVVRPGEIKASVQAVGKDKKIFGYVDKGTKPHEIKAKNGGMLTFKGGYDARTQPAAGRGGAPRGKFGTGKAIGTWVSKQSVHHPGTKARKFAEHFEKQLQPNFRRRVTNALKRAARRH